MAYIGKYIRQILSRQEPVILPGFGSLIIVESKGMKGQEGKIEPPGSIVKFDAEHPKGDGKLAEEYAKGELLDPEEARQQVLELVDAIKFKLDKGEKYVLDQVGVFIRDDDNRVKFLKDPGWVLDPDLFGLASLDLLELEDEKEPEPEQVKVSEPESQKIVTEEKEKEAVIKVDSGQDVKPWERTEEPKKKNKWSVIWIVAASLIVVLAVVLLIPAGDEESGIKFGRNGIVFKNKKTDDTGDTDRIQQADEQEQLTDMEDEPVEDKPDYKENDTENQTTGEVVSENSFFIIAGSFKNIQNANELLVELKSRGFPAELILTENRLYRVSVEGFKTREAGQEGLVRIQQEPGLAGAWLMAR